jgi:hypothetical protein
MQNLDKLIKGDHILGVKDVIFDKDILCSACQAGKQVGGSHPVKNHDHSKTTRTTSYGSLRS